jgi:hypothetical protein
VNQALLLQRNYRQIHINKNARGGACRIAASVRSDAGLAGGLFLFDWSSFVVFLGG